MMRWYTRASRFICGAFGSNNSRISHNLVYQYVRNRYTPFVDGSKFHHFKTWLHQKWSHQSELSKSICVGSGFVFALYLKNLETVPYTRRRHFLLIWSSDEKESGDILLEKIKSKCEGKIVAPDQPLSIRVQEIGHDIVEVVKSQTSHLKEFEWEFVVVDEPTIVNALSLPGGKIIIFTGLLNQFKEDDEIATVIGHEVGHSVARHAAELATVTFFELIRFPSYNFNYNVKVIIQVIYNRIFPVLQRMELEADYIGLILMAYAGYDPRVAPHVYKNLSDEAWDDILADETVIGGDEAWEVFLTNHHPSGETRAQLLLQPKVMEKALSIYKKVLARRGIEF